MIFPLTYLIKSILCSSIFFGYYYLFLKDKHLHQFNRFFLLSSVVLSIVIPLFNFEWHQSASTGSVPYKILQVINTGIVENEPTVFKTCHFSFGVILGIAYSLISIVLLSIFLLRLRWLMRLQKGSDIRYVDGIKVIHTDVRQAPFSYMNNIYWRKDIRIDSEIGKQVWQHELVHIKQHHTIDKIFLQLAVVSFWINPFFWFIQRECAMIHEFIADSRTNEYNDTEQLARVLLQTYFRTDHLSFTNSFFHSPIKRRIIMLQKENKISMRKARKLLVLPLIAGSLLLFSFSITKENIHRSKKRIILALDAGHGGFDKGAENSNGITEKDLNLKVVDKMAAIADDYNIEVVPIRVGDKYLTLQQRVDKANAMRADVLVCIHLNKTTATDNNIRIMLDNRNVQSTASQKLGSAIDRQMRGLGTPSRLYNKGLWVLKNVKMPAVLVECGNINNAESVARIENDKQLTQICGDILNGIVDYENNMK